MDDSKVIQEKSTPGLGYRHQQCLILLLTLTIAYSIRSCMGVALVAMTSHEMSTNPIHKEIMNISALDNPDTIYDASKETLNEESQSLLHALMFVKPYPTFEWNKKVQDMILSSFFWGYMLLQIPAGILAQRFGTRYLLFGSMVINGFVFILLPWAAYYGGWVSTVICRIMQGLSQACIFPSIHTFFGKWAPLQERGRMTAMVYGGQALGTVLGLPMTGLIASSGMGWPGIFRFYGVLCVITAVVLWFFLAETPARHPKISDAERKFIEDELGDNKKLLTVPWSQILRCKAMWASVAAHCGGSVGQIILFTEVPAYMDKVMGVNIKANGVLTALPFFAMWLSNFAFSILTDWTINRKLLSVTNTRKLFNSIGSVIPCICLIMLSFVPKNIYIIETLLVFTCATKVAAHMGFQVIYIDIAPNFAGNILSISNFVANGIASFSPVVSSFIVTDVTSSTEWNRVFYLTGALYFLTNVVFVLFTSAERAEWNEPQPDKTKDVEESVLMIEMTNVEKNSKG